MQTDLKVKYTWVPFFQELANCLLPYRGRGQELLEKVDAAYTRAKLKNDKLKNNLSLKQLQKYNVDPNQVDPFTVLGTINRGLTEQNRLLLCEAFKLVFDLKADVPTDFNGIPIFQNQIAWIIAEDYDVWDIFEAAINYADKGTEKEKFVKSFNTFKDRKTGIRYLTFGLFWIRPYTFISLDTRNEEYIGKVVPELSGKIRNGYDGEEYLEICRTLTGQYDSLNDIHNHVELSMAAYGLSQNFIFQCNPSKYNMQDAMKHLDEMVYSVNKNYVKKIAPYMNVYIWLSGPDGGVAAKAMTISDVGAYQDPEEEEKYYLDGTQEDFSLNNVWIRFTKKLVKVIPKEKIKNHPVLKDLNIFKFSQGTTFPITREQAASLDEMIEGKYVEKPAEAVEQPKEDPVNEEASELDEYSEDDFLNEVYMEPDQYHALINLLEAKKNIILCGAPGVGKTFTAKRLAYAMMGVKDESRIKFIQFHQNYSYEDFVEGYRPKKDSDGFELVDGVFKQFCDQARGKDNKYFFVIDEINRGNLSRIFGELLMLIEADKRGKAEYTADLAYSKQPFTVPDNVYIIGMMNTADRSLAIIDYALRRRFSFFEMKPQLDALEKDISELNDQRAENLVEAVKKLNTVIEKDPALGSGFQIGHSYFCNKKDEESVDAWLDRIVNYDIIPMLEEYWFDNRQVFEEESRKLRKAIDGFAEQ